MDIRELEVGESLFQEGDDADTAYIIEVGALIISTRSDGDKVVICSLVDGDIVGEMGIIDGAPRTATATALKQARLLCVTQNQLTDQISEADDILKLLVQVLLERCRSGLSKMKGDPRSAELELVAREYVHHGINKMRLESELRLALQSDELIVFYQPIVDLRSGHIAGFEALTRWIHPVRGFRSPGLFISLAEETDLIVPVGLQVFKQASADMVRLQNSADAAGYHHPLFMSINVSGRQVINEFFSPRQPKLWAARVYLVISLNWKSLRVLQLMLLPQTVGSAKLTDMVSKFPSMTLEPACRALRRSIGWTWTRQK
ncbi:MAG: hypothetical protein ACJAY2_003593 [Pseudomonadales bacterium]